jgi:1-acyl-sn-glycerol-3-phosphate acyltransferase
MQKENRVNRFYWGCHFIVNLYMRSLCRLDSCGLENIPFKGGLIIASNHTSIADPLLLGSTVPRELWYMAKKELFKVFLLKNIISRLNAFPVDRFGFDIEAIRQSLAVLKQGGALVMFPEGTRSKDSVIREGKIGMGMLARKAGVPIVPAYMENSKNAGINFFKGRKLKIIFGQVVKANWINTRQNSKIGYKEITDEVMKRIKILKQKINPLPRMPD